MRRDARGVTGDGRTRSREQRPQHYVNDYGAGAKGFHGKGKGKGKGKSKGKSKDSRDSKGKGKKGKVWDKEFKGNKVHKADKSGGKRAKAGDSGDSDADDDAKPGTDAARAFVALRRAIVFALCVSALFVPFGVPRRRVSPAFEGCALRGHSEGGPLPPAPCSSRYLMLPW